VTEKIDYLIRKETMALDTAFDPEYQTVIYDQDGVFRSRKSKLELLRDACIHYRMCDFEGVLKGTKQIFNFNKAPIVVGDGLIATPTKSPRSYDCQFIFLANIIDFDATADGLYVTFSNQQQLKLNCSVHTFQKQFSRTIICASYYHGLGKYIPWKKMI
jgi:competence protein ComK